MKRILSALLLLLAVITGMAQNVPPLVQLKADPKKSYGNEYPYLYKTEQRTKAPRG